MPTPAKRGLARKKIVNPVTSVTASLTISRYVYHQDNGSDVETEPIEVKFMSRNESVERKIIRATINVLVFVTGLAIAAPFALVMASPFVGGL